MTEVITDSFGDSSPEHERYVVHYVKLGDMASTMWADPRSLDITFNATAIFLAAARPEAGANPRQYVEVWPDDQQVDDMITALSYYRKRKQELGEWKTDD